jgi:two-component system, NtrC family, sensor histidine kinase HydH
MSRRTIAALGMLAIALGIVVVWVVVTVRRDRATLVEQFGSKQLVQVQRVAQDLQAELEDVSQELRFTGELLRTTSSRADRERILRALLAVVDQYRMAALYDSHGSLSQAVIEPLPSSEWRAEDFSNDLARLAREALLREPGEVATSAALPADRTGWFRAFATPIPSETSSASATSSGSGALVILVDTSHFFRKLQLIATQRESMQIVLAPQGVPMVATDRQLAVMVDRRDSTRSQGSAFDRLIDRMRAGQEGTVSISEAEASALGLGGAVVMAAHAPIGIEGGQHWSIATLRSTSQLREQERASLVRLGAVSTAIVLCLLTFAGYVVVASKRALTVRARLQHAEEVARLHERTGKILDNVPTGIMALSDDERITMINRFLRERIPSCTVGTEFREAFGPERGDTIERFRELQRSARTTGQVQSIIGDEISLFGHAGSYSIHAVPLEGRHSDVRVLLVIEDLTEVRTLASQLLRAEKLATVGIIATGIAHEIGTPLGIVRARAERMISKLPEDHPLTPGALVITKEIDRIARTIRQLLDFSRLEPGNVVPVSVAETARSVVDLLQFAAEPRNVALRVEAPDGLPMVSADPDQLRQVLLNLVLNSCDACASRGTITIRARPEGPDRPASPALMRIEVIDDGCGIKDELRHQVFDPFFTTKKRGKGTGLGLTIAAQIVQSHGGQIDLEREPLGGTRAIVLWPTTAIGKAGVSL